MPVWLLDAIGAVLGALGTSALVVIAHRVERGFAWLRNQANIIDSVDRAGARLAASASHLADAAARLERAAARLEAAGRDR